MFKKRKVVMLPTNEKADLQKYGRSLRLKNSGYYPHVKEILGYYQHLYFLSDEEEIKKGDWFVMNGCIVRQCESTNKEPHTIHTVVDSTGGIHHVSVCEKIIATTDKLLRLPEPSQSFIEKFVEEYNKGNIITEVMVEYENDKEYWAARNLFNPNAIDFKVYTLEEKEKYKGILFDYHPIKLKVNPKDNTITIRKMKDSWNREEVAVLLQKAIFYGMGLEEPRTENSAKSQQKRINKWIEENLLTLLKANK